MLHIVFGKQARIIMGTSFEVQVGNALHAFRLDSYVSYLRPKDYVRIGECYGS